MKWKNLFERKGSSVKREGFEGWKTGYGGPDWDHIRAQLKQVKEEIEIPNSTKSELIYKMMRSNWVDPNFSNDEDQITNLVREGCDRIKEKISNKDPLFNKVPKQYQAKEEDLGFPNAKGWLEQLILSEVQEIAKSRGLLQED